MASKYIAPITDSDFDAQTSNIPDLILVKFWTAGCVPCRQLKPLFEIIAHDYRAKAKFFEANADLAPQLAERFQIKSVPIVIFLKDGKVVDQIVGAQSRSIYTESIKRLIGEKKWI